MYRARRFRPGSHSREFFVEPNFGPDRCRSRSVSGARDVADALPRRPRACPISRDPPSRAPEQAGRRRCDHLGSPPRGHEARNAWHHRVRAGGGHRIRLPAEGAERLGFPSIVGAGPNSTVLHYDKSRRRTTTSTSTQVICAAPGPATDTSFMASRIGSAWTCMMWEAMGRSWRPAWCSRLSPGSIFRTKRWASESRTMYLSPRTGPSF